MYIVYHYLCTCMYMGLATVVVLIFLFYLGHCKCEASLVGPIHVLSVARFHETVV